MGFVRCTISLRPRHKRFAERKNLSLSKLTQKAVEREMKRIGSNV